MTFKRVLTTGILGAAFLSTPVWANCHQCCTNPSDVLYCISSDDGKNCSGGCECCPSASQIGRNSDDTYFCCQGDTPQVTDIQGKEGYKRCCKDGQIAVANSSNHAGICCQDGQVAVVNYANNVGEDGYTCCNPTKPTASEPAPVIGSVNNSCCYAFSNSYNEGELVTERIFSIRQNGGVYFCGMEQIGYTDGVASSWYWYETDGKYCVRATHINNGQLISCQCASVGEPRLSGSFCSYS